MKFGGIVFALVAVSGAAATSHAALLVGTTVTGSLQFGTPTNYYDKTNGFVPATGYLNSPTGPTVVVAEPAIEFGFLDGANAINTNITDSQVLLTDQYLSSFGATSYTVTLTDNAFVGLGVNLVTETFDGTPTASIAGNVLTISVPTVSTSAVNTLALSLFSVSTPEPTSLAAIAGAGLLVFRRRR